MTDLKLQCELFTRYAQLLTMTLFLLHRWWLILVEFANIVNSTNVSTNIETAVLSNLNRWWLHLGEYASYKLWPSLGSVFPPRAPTPLLLIKLPRKWVFAACLRDLLRSMLISSSLSSTNTARPFSTNVRSTTLIKYNQSKSFQTVTGVLNGFWYKTEYQCFETLLQSRYLLNTSETLILTFYHQESDHAPSA